MIHARRHKRSLVADKRNEILKAAIEVFAKKGFNSASINEVAVKAGVASGTVYLYFKNKDDLLLQAMKTMMDTNLQEIKSKIANVEKPIDKLFLFFFHHVEMFVKRPSMARFLMVELRQSEEFYKKHPTYNPYKEYREYIEQLVSLAMQDGTTKPYNPSTISFIILGFMDNLVTEWLINPEQVDMESTILEMREILKYGTRT
jgi:TetR/AcrR family transcriptional regulator, fatty acid metabolism regulator protein